MEGDRQTDPDKLHPSSLGSCMKKAMYQFHEQQDKKNSKPVRWRQTHPMDAATRWRLYRYGWYEKPFEDALSKDAAFQVPNSNDRWAWRTDMLMLRDGPDFIWDIVDVKSVSPYVPTGELPYAHHLPQIHAYYVLEDKYGVPTGDAYLAYITRWKEGNLPDIYEFKVTPTEQQIEEVKKLMAKYEDWSERDELPPRPYPDPIEHPWDCTYYIKKYKQVEIRCPWFGHCWPAHVDDLGEFCEPY